MLSEHVKDLETKSFARSRTRGLCSSYNCGSVTAYPITVKNKIRWINAVVTEEDIQVHGPPIVLPAPNYTSRNNGVDGFPDNYRPILAGGSWNEIPFSLKDLRVAIFPPESY